MDNEYVMEKVVGGIHGRGTPRRRLQGRMVLGRACQSGGSG